MTAAVPPVRISTLRYLILAACFNGNLVFAQVKPAKTNDVLTPLHLMKPDYTMPYGKIDRQSVKAVMDRVYGYLSANTPIGLVDAGKGSEISRIADAGISSVFKQGDFRLISYEWGVTYHAMLEAGQATQDKRYTDYTLDRLRFIAEVANVYRGRGQSEIARSPVRSVLDPHALDDAGAMAAAMIKASRTGLMQTSLRPMIDNYLHYIVSKEFRLQDGTLARNRPQPNTLWLDDLYMSIPALAQMALLTGQNKYFDEGLRQYELFSKRMFNNELGLYMHGWVQDMNPHPRFYWARANGWALLTKIELLDALPDDHPRRADILEMLARHAAGLARCQDGSGFWHQLLDKENSYLETSATAIYAYCFSRAVNKGWLDAKAYGPAALLAWAAVSTKVNTSGQVEGTCVGTGMGFDPAFYCFRPVNNYAAHGYGPVLLAAAEIYRMLDKHPPAINDSAVQVYR